MPNPFSRTMIRELAASLANILEVQGGKWIGADPTAPSFGDEVPAVVVGDPHRILAPDEPGV